MVFYDGGFFRRQTIMICEMVDAPACAGSAVDLQAERDRSVAMALNTADLEEGLFMAGLEAHYSARDIEARILAAIRAAGLNPEQRLSPEELGALDHFHTGGLRASRELLELAQIRAEDRVLDIGAGLAGAARLLASALGCRVDCLELSPDFCAGAVLLNRLTGLDDRIDSAQGQRSRPALSRRFV